MIPPQLYDSPPNFVRGKAGLAHMLEDDPSLDAVFFPNDTTAIGGMMHCLSAGIGIPEDIALVGYSGLTIGQNMPLRLTTIETKRFETGQTAAANILKRLSGRRTAPVSDMGYTLLRGETT